MVEGFACLKELLERGDADREFSEETKLQEYRTSSEQTHPGGKAVSYGRSQRTIHGKESVSSGGDDGRGWRRGIGF